MTPQQVLTYHVNSLINEGNAPIVEIPAPHIEKQKTPTLRATVKPFKGFRVVKGTWIASLPGTGWEAKGSKNGCIPVLIERLRLQNEHSQCRRYIRKGNVTFALYYADGWQYDIIRDDGKASTCAFGAQSARDAFEQMKHHADSHDGI